MDDLPSRRRILTALGAALGTAPALALLASRPAAALAAPAASGATLDVWKSPSCGCCGGWVEHMRAAGFAPRVHEAEDLEPVKRARGVPPALASCHTAVVDGYVVEGHVPAADVLRLLAERPRARGLAVPGMPMDAPGMDGRTGEPYEVVLFGAEGGDRVFARH
jgi:hypothetical protein